MDHSILYKKMPLTCLCNASRAGHLLCDQSPHRHSGGGKSGKGADGKYRLWDRTLYQEYRFKQGQQVSLLCSVCLQLLHVLTNKTKPLTSLLMMLYNVKKDEEKSYSLNVLLEFLVKEML